MPWLNTETQRASLNRIVVTARVIIFAIECLQLKVSVTSFSVGYLIVWSDKGELFLKVKFFQEACIVFAGPNNDCELRKRKILGSYFLRGLMAVISNLHNFMLSTKRKNK